MPPKTVHDDGGTCGCGTPPKNNLELNRGRSCQDVPMMILFCLYMIGVAIIAAWAVENGDAERLMYGADSWGNVCGREENKKFTSNVNSGLDLSGQPHQYFTLSNENRAVCLASCPTESAFCGIDGLSTPAAACTASGVCLGEGTSGYETPTNGSTTACPDSLIASTEVGFINRCAPISTSNTSLIAGFTDALNAGDWQSQVVADFYATRITMLILLVVAAIASLACIISMRIFAGLVVWLAIIISVVVAIAFTGTIWYYGVLAKSDESDVPDNEEQDTDTENSNFILFSATAITVITVLYICLIVAMRSRIKQAIAVMKTTASALTKTMGVFVCPFIVWGVVLAWGSLWILISMYVLTADTVTEDPDTGYAVFTDHDKINFVWLYMILALFWGVQFVVAAMEFTVASSIVIWYLSHGKPEGWVVMKSFGRLLRYHIGSIAFGALLVAIVQTVRVVFEYLTKKAEDAQQGEPSCCFKFCVCCIRCCLKCLETCVKWINKNAYIEIAIWGDGFMSSACRGMSTMSEFIPLLTVATGVAWLLVTVIKIAVTFSIGMLAYIVLEPRSDEVPMYGFVVAFVIALTFLVVSAFTGVYDIGASTLLLCVMEDYKDGRETGKYYMNDMLRECWPVDEKTAKVANTANTAAKAETVL